MGIFTFTWPHVAEEVYVTGTFDNWSKSEKLEKVGDGFQKTVTLPVTTENIFYKFVVDGIWTTDHAAPMAKDHEGNDNNLLKPEDIMNETSPAAVIMNTVAPESTTAELAKDAPLEKKEEAPAAEEKKDEAASDLPGAFPVTPAADLDKQFGVNPLPATDGAVNPVKLGAGEKVPEGITGTNGIHNHVTLDKESYEKSDRIPGLEATELPPVTSTMIPESSLPIVGSDAVINSAAADSSTAALAAKVPLEEPKVPEVVKESQERAGEEPGAAGLSDAVEDKAKVEDELLEKVPEASSTSEGTSGKGTEKAETDKSLAETLAASATAAGAALIGAALLAKETILEKAPTSEQVSSTAGAANDTVVESATSAAQQATDATISAKDAALASGSSAAQQATDATTSAKDTVVANVQAAAETTKATVTDAAGKLPEPVKGFLPAAHIPAALPAPDTKEEIREEISPEVPEEVKESIAESGQEPEAAGNTAAVENKSAVESELLQEVKEVKPIDEQPKEEPKEEAKPAEQPKPAEAIPVAVKESIPAAGTEPEAAASTPAVEKKTAVESELLQEVEPTKPIDEQPEEESKAAESAPKVEEATPVVAPLVTQPEPTTTTTEAPKAEEPAKAVNGAELAGAPAAKEAEAPSTPSKAAAPVGGASSSTSKPNDSPATAEKKKKHRLSSFLTKVKNSFKDKP